MLTDRSTRGAIGLNNGIHDVGVNLTRNLLSRDGHLIAGKAHQTLQQTAICAVVKDTGISPHGINRMAAVGCVARCDLVEQRSIDRKSVGEGKSVTGRVDLGGRRVIKKKKITKNK